MTFIETYGCKKNSGLKNLGVSSGLDDVLSLDENASLDVYSDDVKEFLQHYEKEIRDIINRKDEKEKFDEICRFLKEQQTFEYFLNNADKDCNRKYYFISFWNVVVLFQQKDIARFDISKENLYLNYCKLIDKISDGAFEDFGENHMEGNYNAYDDPEWLCEEVAQIVMLPNGWFVCKCDNVF